MPVYVHAPLPGPFTVSKRIGGKRKRKPAAGNPILGVALAVLLFPLFISLVVWWLVLAVSLVLGTTFTAVAILLAPLPGRVRRFELARRPFKAPVMMWRGLLQACRKVGLL